MYITASQRSDYPSYRFKIVGDTYLKVGERRYPIISADGIELNKLMQTNKDGKLKMAFRFPPLPKGTQSFDFIEGDADGGFLIKGIKPVEERWKQLFPSYWRDDKGNWHIAFFEDAPYTIANSGIIRSAGGTMLQARQKLLCRMPAKN